MYEFVLGHSYLPKWAGPTVENTYYSTVKLALSDRIGFTKNKDDVNTGKFFKF